MNVNQERIAKLQEKMQAANMDMYLSLIHISEPTRPY